MHTLKTSVQQVSATGVKMATTSYRDDVTGLRHDVVARLEPGDGQDRLSAVHIRVEGKPVMRFSEADGPVQRNDGTGPQAGHAAGTLPLGAAAQRAAKFADSSAGGSAGVKRSAPRHQAHAESDQPVSSGADAATETSEKRAKDIEVWKEKHGISDDMIDERSAKALMQGNRSERANARSRVLYRATNPVDTNAVAVWKEKHGISDDMIGDR